MADMDNEPLSQDALDALMNSFGNEDAESPAEGSGIDPALFATGDPLAEDAGIDPSIFATEETSPDMPFAGMTSNPTAKPTATNVPLTMASFDSEEVSFSQHPLQGFDRVQDIPLEIAVELGRTRLLIKDILELGSGTIIELEKMAGEPVDLLANGLLIARGEVVVIEDSFGVRITEIITSSERKALIDHPSERAA